MILLFAAALTPSGRPALAAGELERCMLDHVDLEFEGQGGLPDRVAPAYKGGYVVLTTQRIIWVEAAAANAAFSGGSDATRPSGLSCALPVHAINSYTRRSTLSFGGSKVRLHLEVYANKDQRPVLQPQGLTLAQLILRCRGEGPERLMQQLGEVLRLPPPAALPPQLQSQNQAGQQQPYVLYPPGSQQQPQGPPNQAPQPSRQQAPSQGPDAVLLQRLVDMGFGRNKAARALLAVSNAGAQQALDYLLAFGDSLEDTPLESQSSAGSQGGRSLAAQPQQQLPYQQYPPPAYNAPQQPFSTQPWQPGGSGGASTANPLLAPTSSQSHQQQQQQQLQPAMTGFSVGVTGIVRREAERTQEAEATLTSAFSDLHALMSLAADMVRLAERFRGVSQAQGGPSGAEADELMDVDTQQQLIDLGITSPVTRQSAGARFHLELARQLADFLLAGPLKNAGGLLPLADVYCLFNRARGTELVSPEDLLTAVKLFEKAGLPLSLRAFPSGLMAVQSAAHSDDAVCARIAALAQPVQGTSSAPGAGSEVSDDSAKPPWLHTVLGPPVTAVDVARALGCGTSVAAEHLALAESRGVLCRDYGPEGLRFFRNFFRDHAGLTAAA